VVHELIEEVNIQVSLTDLTVWEKMLSETTYKKFCQRFIYCYEWDKSLVKPEEWTIEKLRRRKPTELKEYLAFHPDEFVGSMSWCSQKFL
jgi:8-oxo-dGTP pyrophosphatase MutT (NUDIX family)